MINVLPGKILFVKCWKKCHWDPPSSLGMSPLESVLPSEWLPGPQGSERKPRALVSISAPVALLITITQIADYSYLQKKKKKKLSEDKKAPVWKPLHFITTRDTVTVLILITALSVFFPEKAINRKTNLVCIFFPYLTSSTPLNCQGEWVTWA